MSEPELNPCPFCGLRDARLAHEFDTVSKRWLYVTCDDCESRGPISLDGKKAARMWNARADGAQRKDNDDDSRLD